MKEMRRKKDYGLNFISTTHWNMQKNIVEITYGSYITLTHLINYKRFSLDSRILACGAKSAEQLTIGQD